MEETQPQYKMGEEVHDNQGNKDFFCKIFLRHHVKPNTPKKEVKYAAAGKLRAKVWGYCWTDHLPNASERSSPGQCESEVFGAAETCGNGVRRLPGA